jgi:hypothetical protein
VNGSEVFAPGWNPQWLNDDTLVFVGKDDFPYSLHLPTKRATKLSNVKVAYIVGGGDTWHTPDPGEIGASVDSQNGIVARCIEHNGNNFDRTIMLGGRAIVAHQSVQFPFTRDGLLVWILWTGQSAIDREPWGCINGGPPRRLRVFRHGWEGSPVPFITPSQEPWLLTQTNWDLRLHPWNSTAGYIIKTGEDKNFNPDVRCVGQTIVVVCNDGHGVLSRFQIPLSQPRTEVTVPAVVTPTPPPPTPPPPEIPVSYPNCKRIVETVRATFPSGPMEKPIQGRFLIAVAQAIRRAHPTLRPGLHKKSGSNSFPLPNGVTVDGDLIVFPDGHLFDVLGKEEIESTPAWIDEGVHPNSIPAYYDVLTHFPCRGLAATDGLPGVHRGPR